MTGSYTAEEKDFSENYQSTLTDISEAASEVMEDLSRDFWRCDPKQHQRGVTYEEVTRLLQGHIEVDGDLASCGSCKFQCSSFKNSRAPLTCKDVSDKSAAVSACVSVVTLLECKIVTVKHRSARERVCTPDICVLVHYKNSKNMQIMQHCQILPSSWTFLTLLQQEKECRIVFPPIS